MEEPNYSQQLKIADFIIQLNSTLNFELEEGYLPFICNETSSKPDVTVECFEGLIESDINENELVFEAKSDTQRFYSIYKKGEDLLFLIFDQDTKDNIQQIATLDKTYSNWKIFSHRNDQQQLIPLRFPLGSIIMHYLTINSDSVMMHASAAFDGEKTRVFTGFSGNGKSTISKIMWEAGNKIINDDRIIIRKYENQYIVYNTPMYYRDNSKSAPLNAIYLIRHSPDNIAEQLKGANAVSNVMAFCIQNNFEKQFIQNRLNFFSDLCTNVDVYKLGFVPNASVVDYIIANEK